jgi:hypothetical protein
VVGNGMSGYQNPVIGLSFEYPSNWKLVESAQGKAVRIDSQNAARTPEKGSSIQFSLEPSLNGQSFQSIDELKAYLTEQFPNHAWEPITFSGGQIGYFWRVSSEGREIAAYYLLDQNYNVLSVSYDATLDLNGAGVVRKIVSALSIDFETPVINSISLSKSLSAGGEEFTVSVDTYDMIGDIASVEMEFSILDLNHSALEPIASSAFQWKSGSLFETTVKLPKFAPSGYALPVSITVTDTKGNSVIAYSPKDSLGKYIVTDGNQFELKAKDTISRLAKKQGPLLSRALEIGPNPNGLEDRNGPQIIRIWFDRSLTTESNYSQRIYFEVREDSAVRNWIGIDFAGNYCINRQSGGNWIPMNVRHERKNVYSSAIDLSYCYGNPCSNESDEIGSICLARVGKTRNVRLRSVKLIDEVGNSQNSPAPEDTGFMMYR